MTDQEVALLGSTAKVLELVKFQNDFVRENFAVEDLRPNEPIVLTEPVDQTRFRWTMRSDVDREKVESEWKRIQQMLTEAKAERESLQEVS